MGFAAPRGCCVTGAIQSGAAKATDERFNGDGVYMPLFPFRLGSGVIGSRIPMTV